MLLCSYARQFQETLDYLQVLDEYSVSRAYAVDWEKAPAWSDGEEVSSKETPASPMAGSEVPKCAKSPFWSVLKEE